jgi:hypothetical protein
LLLSDGVWLSASGDFIHAFPECEENSGGGTKRYSLTETHKLDFKVAITLGCFPGNNTLTITSMFLFFSIKQIWFS